MEFKYPENIRPYAGEGGVELRNNVEAPSDKVPAVFAVRGYQSDYCYDPGSNDASFLHYGLREFVQMLTQCYEGTSCYQEEYPSRSIKPITETEELLIDGVLALRFTMVGILHTCMFGGAYSPDEPVAVIHADHNGKRTQIVYPVDDPRAPLILQTFRFLPVEQ